MIKEEIEELKTEYLELSKKYEELLKRWNYVSMIAFELFQDEWNSEENSKIITCMNKMIEIKNIFKPSKVSASDVK